MLLSVLKRVAVLSVFFLTLAVGYVDALQAGCRCAACGYQEVKKTVYVPTMVAETRTVEVTECRPESRKRMVTYHKPVPETRQVTENFTVLVKHKKTRTVECMVAKPVWEEVEHQYTVCVPHQETRKGVRKVCRPIKVQATRTVCRDEGHWKKVACSCGGCHPCGVCGGRGTHCVWVPKIVTEEVPVTLLKTEIVDEPFEHTVTVFKKELKTRMVKVCRFVPEKKTREQIYYVCVPEQRSRTRNITTCKLVPEQREVSFTMMVPHKVKKQIQVMVCRPVAKTVTCRVPVPCCGSCCR